MSRLEFETLAKLRTHLQQSNDLTGAVFQALDLTTAGPLLQTAVLKDNVLLGCTVTESVLNLFERPVVFPQLPDLPFKPYRAFLYSPEELFDGYSQPESYEATVDGRIYQHYINNGRAHTEDVVITLARRLHDHAITDALQEFLAEKKVVAIMGGHSMKRSDPLYQEVAFLARDLVRSGFLPASGGGPGAMEATHLGAWFAARRAEELLDAIKILSAAPLYDPIDRWLDTAFEVREKYPMTAPEQSQSLGIPTWLYGHEPPTCFALNIAKYFANSVREEGLLAIATCGVIFAPGSAGTIQEIFQDATQNHYNSFGIISPMIFLGEDFWQVEKPVYPLLRRLARGYPYYDLLRISNDRQQIVKWLVQFRSSTSAP